MPPRDNQDQEPDEIPPQDKPPAGGLPPKGFLTRAWQDAQRRVAVHAGPLSYAFNIPASGALVWTGVGEHNVGLMVAGALALVMEAVVIAFGSRKVRSGRDAQDDATFGQQITKFWKYPYEFAAFWGELATYSSLIWGGASSEKLSTNILALEGMAQLSGVGIVLVREREKPQAHYGVDIPVVPGFVNRGIERAINARAVKPLTDYVVTRPAAASNFLPKIAFAAYGIACFREASWSIASMPASQIVYLACGATSILLYDQVRKRQLPALPVYKI